MSESLCAVELFWGLLWAPSLEAGIGNSVGDGESLGIGLSLGEPLGDGWAEAIGSICNCSFSSAITGAIIDRSTPVINKANKRSNITRGLGGSGARILPPLRRKRGGFVQVRDFITPAYRHAYLTTFAHIQRNLGMYLPNMEYAHF